MQVGDGREGTAGDEDQGSLVRILHGPLETEVGEVVVVHGGGHGRRTCRDSVVDVVTAGSDQVGHDGLMDGKGGGSGINKMDGWMKKGEKVKKGEKR